MATLGKEMVKTVDPVKRRELWGKWWEFFIDYAQTVPLYEIDNIYAMNDKFDWKPRRWLDDLPRSEAHEVDPS